MMKRKERINRARLHKLARLGIGLVALTALGGGVSPVGDYLFSNPSVVYAETYTNTSDQPIVVVVHYHGQNLDGTTVSLTEKGEFIEFQPGQEIAAPREFEGYTLTETSYVPPAFSEGLLMYSYTQVETPKQPEPTEKPVDTPAEKQTTSSEIRILNVDGATYWKGEGLDKAVVGTTTVELEVGGDLTIPATVVPEGYEITDIRFNALSAVGVKELPHTWTYEEYKNYTSAPMSVPEIDILVKPVSSPANPTTPSAETPTEQPPQPITFPVRYVSVDYTADKGVVITGVFYETTATVEPGGTVFIENKTFDGYSLDTMEGPWKNEYSYEDVVAAGWSDGIDLRYSAKTPTVDTPVTPPTETPSVESPAIPPVGSKPTEASPVTNQSTENQPAQTGDFGSQTDKKPVGQPAQESQLAQPQAKQESVKPQQETTQGAKSLPATGEAGSILGLAGLGFTGLSGLHYALRSRKRQRSARK